MGTALSLVVGYGCEWTHLPFTMPLEVWTVKVQPTVTPPPPPPSANGQPLANNRSLRC